MEASNSIPKNTRKGNTNNLIQPLLTDKYQVSMCYAYWRDNKHNDIAVFDLFFRKNPFRGEYTIFAGLSECLTYLRNFKFIKRDLDYLKSIPDYKHIEPEFWLYLDTLDASNVKLYAFQEGTVCFPNLPLLRIDGPLGFLQLIETALLNLINYASLVTTNAARFKFAVNSGNSSECKLLEFGLRRAQGPDGGFSGSRYAYVGGFDATSNLLAGREFNIPVCGTQSHAFIMSYCDPLSRDNSEEHKYLLNKKTNKEENFTLKILDLMEDILAQNLLGKTSSSFSPVPSELKAFASFAYAFPNNFLALVDTYDVIGSGAINFCIVAMALLHFGYKPIGVRIDSGDLAYLSRFTRNLFNAVEAKYNILDFASFEIVASNDINEETINSLNDQNHSITSFGIGTHLITCQSQPALGCVYKLVEISGRPCMKLSSTSEKITIPYKKACYRLYGKDGNALIDLLTLDTEDAKPKVGKRILCRHPFALEKRCYVTPSRIESLLHLWWDGELKPLPDLEAIRNHCGKSLDYLTEDIKRSLNPTPYKVAVSEELFDLLNELKLSLTPIGELC